MKVRQQVYKKNSLRNLENLEWKPNTKEISFTLQLVPRPGTEYSFVDFEIEVNTKSTVTVSFGNEKTNLKETTYVS